MNDKVIVGIIITAILVGTVCAAAVINGKKNEEQEAATATVVTTQTTEATTTTTALSNSDPYSYELINTVWIDDIAIKTATEWEQTSTDPFTWALNSQNSMLVSSTESGYADDETEEYFLLSLYYDVVKDNDELKDVTEYETTKIAGCSAITFSYGLSGGTVDAYALINGDKTYVITFTMLGDGTDAERAYFSEIIGSIQAAYVKPEPQTEATTEPPTEAPTDPPTEAPTEPQYSFEAFTVSGYGDSVTEISLPQEVVVYEAFYYGEGYFSMDYYDAAGEKDYLVSEIDSYGGARVLQADRYDTSQGLLEVEADGEWEISFYPLEQFVPKEEYGSFSGSGDYVTGVFRATSSNTVVNCSYTGDGYFSVDTYEYGDNSRSKDYTFSSIDSYNGQAVVRTEIGKLYFFGVEADGNWELSVE